jgi:hypothetical protein
VTTKAKDDRQASVSQEERNERLRTYAAARLDPVEIALVVAFMQFVAEGAPLAPTAAQISARAGHPPSEYFKRFKDFEELQDRAFAQALRVGHAFAMVDVSSLDRPGRIADQVKVRATNCEGLRRTWKAAQHTRWVADFLAPRQGLVQYMQWARMEQVYRPELSGLPDAQRRRMMIALDLITTVRAWNDLRESQQMSFDQASEFWRQAIDRLLPPTPAAP